MSFQHGFLEVAPSQQEKVEALLRAAGIEFNWIQQEGVVAYQDAGRGSSKTIRMAALFDQKDSEKAQEAIDAVE